jgi:hypothetical protein
MKDWHVNAFTVLQPNRRFGGVLWPVIPEFPGDRSNWSIRQLGLKAQSGSMLARVRYLRLAFGNEPEIWRSGRTELRDLT